MKNLIAIVALALLCAAARELFNFGAVVLVCLGYAVAIYQAT